MVIVSNEVVVVVEGVEEVTPAPPGKPVEKPEGVVEERPPIWQSLARLIAIAGIIGIPLLFTTPKPKRREQKKQR